MYPEFSQGLNGLGARRKHSLSSRNGSVENTFSKFEATIKHKRRLPYDFQANWNFKWQLPGEKLASQEGFPLGGIDSVRGYPAQDYIADAALQNNFELEIPLLFVPKDVALPFSGTKIRDDVKGLIFFDHAYGEKRGAFATETDDVHYASYGAGMRIRLYDQVLLRLEWGFAAGDASITEAGKSRFHFAISFEDKFFEKFMPSKSEG